MDKSVRKQPNERAYKVAAASSDGIVVNRHFGRADTFYIYEVNETGEYGLCEKRTVEPICHGGNHDDNELCKNVDSLRDCQYVLVSKIGPGAAMLLEQAGIATMELPMFIDDAIQKVHSYKKIQELFN